MKSVPLDRFQKAGRRAAQEKFFQTDRRPTQQLFASNETGWMFKQFIPYESSNEIKEENPVRRHKISSLSKLMPFVISAVLTVSYFPIMAYSAPVVESPDIATALLDNNKVSTENEAGTEVEGREVEVPETWPLEHVSVQPGDIRIQNSSLRMDIGRLGQVNRLNIIDSDLSRPQDITSNREMNFVAGQHNWSTAFTEHPDHQWIGEMIFSIRTASTRESLAEAGPFIEVDTNRTLQAGGRVTNNNPDTDPNLNAFFNRDYTDKNRITVQINPDPNDMPTGNESNPSDGNLNSDLETAGLTAQRRERIITNFQVTSLFDADTDDNSILWSITITNPTENEYIEFGDIGLPMLWNVRYSRQNTSGVPRNNAEHVYDNAVTSHSYQGADSGYLKVVPARGDNFVIFTPVPQSGARIEYVDHWTRDNWGVSHVHRSGFGIWGNDRGTGTAGNTNNYNLPGLTVAYIHSSNIRNISGSSYFHDTNNGPTYFTNTNHFPARYNPVTPDSGFSGGGNPSGPDYTPLFTSLVLGPGESQTYQFKFHAVRGGDGEPETARGGRNNRIDTQNLEPNHMMEREINMRSIIHDMGMIDAVAVPSFQPAINMQTLIALRHDRSQVDISDVRIYSIHENDVFSDQHIPAWGSQAGRNRSRVTNTRGGRGLPDGNPNYTRSATLREDLSGYHDGEWVSVYELTFDSIGHNSVRVYYDLINGSEVIRPAFTQVEFNVLTELDELTMAHADFLRTQQQFSASNRFQFSGDPSLHPLYGIYFDWHIGTGPSRITGFSTSDIFTPPPGAPGATRWGDDWSHGHAQFMALANYMNPGYENIRSLETYLIDFMWHRYMGNRHDTLLVPNFLHESPIAGSSSTTGDRFFSAAIVANTFFNMYRTMRAFPDFMEYRKDALFYLDIAAGIWDNGLRGGWGASSGVAFYGEQQIEEIIQALHHEGRHERRDSLRYLYTQIRAPGALSLHWPFGSEFEYDNTTEEGIYARALSIQRHSPDHSSIIQGGEDRVLRLMQIFNLATRAKRGWQPTWFQYGVPVFRGGESWWNFQYTTSLAGFIMDDWLRFRYDLHNWDQRSLSWANRVNYAAKIGNFNHVNMGQISEDHIGAASVTYSMRKGTFGAQAVQIAPSPTMHNGWHDMGMEAPLAIYGSLLSISTDVVNDPVFGFFAYGGTVTAADGNSISVRPADGFGRRLNFLEDRVYIYSRNNRITEARFIKDKSRLELDLNNLTQGAHVAQIDAYGLTPGFYNITLNDAPAGQFYVHATDRNEGATGIGPRALEATAFVKIPNGDNFTVTFARAADGTAIEPSLNIVLQVADPVVGNKLPLLVEVVGDGSSEISSVNWTVVNAPEPDTITFYSETPILGGDYTTSGRRNSVWTHVDTSELRRAVATPLATGEYTVQATVTTGGFTVSEEITFTAVEDPLAAAPELIETGYDQSANTISLRADAVAFDSSGTRPLTFQWELIDWPDGGHGATIITSDDGVEVISRGLGAGYFYRSNAMLSIQSGGEYTVQLSVSDSGRVTRRDLTISAHDDFNIKAYNIVSQAGSIPTDLPRTISFLAGGEVQELPIVWEPLDESRFMDPGAEVELFGTVEGGEGMTVDVEISVFVVADIEARANEAPDGNIFATWNNPGDLGGMTVVQRTNTPSNSANYSPAETMGAWHNWGRETSPERIEITWDTPRLVDRTDVYVMQNAAGSFRPFFDDLQVLTDPPLPRGTAGRPTSAANSVWLNENWVTPRNLQGMGTANTLHQFNEITFEPLYVHGVALYLSPGAGPTELGVGLLRWWPMGYSIDTEVGESPLAPE